MGRANLVPAMLIGDAPAKVNLTLEVIGKRPDGFHELRSVMQTIDLVDEIRVEDADALTFSCDDPSLAGDDNLVVRTARALQTAAGVNRGARIHLSKRIPAAAGLGGGSSDAATTLRLLNRIWGIYWPRERLSDLAATLGSDVPFFLWGGTALVEGRGERVQALPPVPPMWFVLLRGDESPADKTRRIFAQTTPADYGDGSATGWLVADLAFGAADPATFVNTLTVPAERAFPNLVAARTTLHAAGATHVLLSGAGPTLFAATADRQEAETWAARLRDAGHAPIVAASLPA